LTFLPTTVKEAQSKKSLGEDSFMEVQERTFEGVIEFNIMTPKDGHKRLVWDANDPKQVEESRKQFYEHVKKGFFAYAVDEATGKQRGKMLRFDARAQELILDFDQVVEHSKAGKKVVMHPALVGG
jgi:hypothetical protein